MTDFQDFSELYPGRFLKAGLFKGQPVTYTIKKIEREELVGDKGPEAKIILSFEETPLDLVLAKVNAIAIKAMFGASVPNWIGKRVTFYGTTAIMPFPGKRDEPCIRVYGSPDIDAEIRCEWKPPKRNTLVQILKPVQSPTLTAALAAIETAADNAALDKFATRADELLAQRKITQSEHGQIAKAINDRRKSDRNVQSPIRGADSNEAGVAADSGSRSELSADNDSQPTPLATDAPGLNPEPAPDAAVSPELTLRARQAIVRLVNTQPEEIRNAFIKQFCEHFNLEPTNSIASLIKTQAHADFINEAIKGQ